MADYVFNPRNNVRLKLVAFYRIFLPLLCAPIAFALAWLEVPNLIIIFPIIFIVIAAITFPIARHYYQTQQERLDAEEKLNPPSPDEKTTYKGSIFIIIGVVIFMAYIGYQFFAGS